MAGIYKDSTTKTKYLETETYSGDCRIEVDESTNPPTFTLGDIKIEGGDLEMLLDELFDERATFIDDKKQRNMINSLLDKCNYGKRVQVERSASGRLQTPYEQRLRAVFDNWNGSPTPKQSALLQEGGLEYKETTGKYNRIQVIGDEGRFISVSCTPKDEGSAARAIFREIRRYLID